MYLLRFCSNPSWRIISRYNTSASWNLLKNNKGPLPIFFVIIENSHVNIDNLNNIRYIDQIWSFQAHKPKGFKQCCRCQRSNHSSQNCTFPYRCLECSENHTSSECMKTRCTPAKRCNFKGSHPANFGQCSANPRNKNRYTLSPSVLKQVQPPTNRSSPIQSKPFSVNAWDKSLEFISTPAHHSDTKYNYPPNGSSSNYSPNQTFDFSDFSGMLNLLPTLNLDLFLNVLIKLMRSWWHKLLIKVKTWNSVLLWR